MAGRFRFAIPGQMPDVGSKLLNPMANDVGTDRNLWRTASQNLWPRLGAWLSAHD